MSEAWFRWYRGTCADGKMRVVARKAGVSLCEVIGLWATLLEDAGHMDHRGVCLLDEDDFAAILDLSNESVMAILTALQAKQMIEVTEQEISVTNWKQRQYESDTVDNTNAERQRRYRKRKKNEHTVTRNGDVTAEKRPDTESDTDNTISEFTNVNSSSETSSDKPPKKKYSDQFEEFWKRYPTTRTMDKAKTAKVFQALNDQQRHMALEMVAAFEAEFRRENKDATMLHAERYLRRKLFENFADGGTGPPGGETDNILNYFRERNEKDWQDEQLSKRSQ